MDEVGEMQGYHHHHHQQQDLQNDVHVQNMMEEDIQEEGVDENIMDMVHHESVPEAVEGEEEVIADGEMMHHHHHHHHHHDDDDSLSQPITPDADDEDLEPPIPEPVYHEEVKQSPDATPSGTPIPNMQGPHLSPAPPQPIPPKLTPQEISLITEAASKPGPNGTFQCTLCNKQFGYKNGLIRHIRLTHVGEKPYECNICHRRFGYKHILMEHQNLHYGHRPYACAQCDKRFAARSNLIQHRMVHKRPFNCGLCNKRFDKEDQLKKHLFAHPQALLNCTLCKFAAPTQNDLNKHIMDEHAAAIQEGLRRNGEGLSPLPLPTRESYSRQTEPITPPGTVSSPEDLSQNMANNMMAQSMATLRVAMERGQRIEHICSQLSTSAANSSPTDERFQGVVIKKEIGNGDADAVRMHHVEQAYHMANMHPPVSGAMLLASTAEQMARVSAGMSVNSNHITNVHVSSPSLNTSSMAEEGNRAAEELHKSTLPGIHEMFRRTPNHMVPFSNFPGSVLPHALALASENRQHINELTNILSPPPSLSQGAIAHMFMPPQRPPTQLPPITSVLSQKKDQAIQHTANIPGHPSLDDVLAYYVGQGKLFKCQFCDILFFERGMYFLHASLHGPSSPWECSICHKICSDKNEFTIHFVNQQHNL